MSRLLNSLRRIFVPVLAIAVSGVLLTACLKNKDDNNVNIPAAGLLGVNLAPDQQSVVIGLSGNSLTVNPLSFPNYTGGYRNIFPGQRTIDAYDYPNSTPFASVTSTFDSGMYYSVFVIGLNGKYKNVLSKDNLDSLNASSGNAFVRYVNAITDSTISPAVTIKAGTSSVVDETATYGSVSAFKEVAPGDIMIAVKNGSAVDTSRTITVEARKIYTILLAGVPGSTEESKRVQIRYITNGELTDDSK